MARTTIQVDGLRELGQAIRKMEDDFRKKTARAMTAAAAGVVKKAAAANVQGNPSIDTGMLQKSIISKAIPRGQTSLTSEHIVTVRGRGKKKKDGTLSAGAPYAHHVEFGTVNMAAEPFLRPALSANIRDAAEAMRDRGAARLKRALK